MNNEEFEKILFTIIEHTKNTLSKKGHEYSSDNDRLYNFKQSASIDPKSCKITPKIALWGMAKKHLVSVIDIIYSKEPVSQEFAREKIGDLINYLILLEIMLYEERSDITKISIESYKNAG